MAPIVAVIAATSELEVVSMTEMGVALTMRAPPSVDYDSVARLALIVEAEAGVARAKAVLIIEAEAGVARAKAVVLAASKDVVIDDDDASKKCKEAGGAQDSINDDDNDDEDDDG